MRKLYAVCVLVGFAMGAASLVRAQGAKPAAAKPITWSASELKWVDNPAIKGAQQAVLWGDPTKGAYGALKKIPAGAVLPMHTHTHANRVLTVAGTITLTIEGAAAKDMGPQAFAAIPGGVKHTATCKAGADCVYFETSDRAFDMKLVPSR